MEFHSIDHTIGTLSFWNTLIERFIQWHNRNANEYIIVIKFKYGSQTLYSRCNRHSIMTAQFKSIHHSAKGVIKLILKLPIQLK